MAADISQSLKDWSATPASNLPTGATAVGPNLDDNLRNLQAAVRADLGSRDTIASAATTDIGTKDAGGLDVTGTTTITSLGTLTAGLRKTLTFGGALTLTHNATSLILPGGTNITTAAGDNAEFVSLGSGNWRCLWYAKASGQQVAATYSFPDGTVGAPGASFGLDLDNGLYRIGANNWAMSVGGAKAVDLGTSLVLSPSAGGSYSFGNALSLTAGAGGAINITAASNSGGTGSAINIIGGPAAGGLAGGKVTIGGGIGGLGSDVDVKSGGATNSMSGNLRLFGADTTAAGTVNANTQSVYIFNGGSQPGYINNAVVLLSARIDTSLQKDIVQMSGKTGVMEYLAAAGVPSVSAGAGTGASVTGTNYGCRVLFGTSAGTSFTITLANPAASTQPNIAACVLTFEGASNIACWIASISGRVITVSMASAPPSGAALHCITNFYV